MSSRATLATSFKDSMKKPRYLKVHKSPRFPIRLTRSHARRVPAESLAAIRLDAVKSSTEEVRSRKQCGQYPHP